MLNDTWLGEQWNGIGKQNPKASTGTKPESGGDRTGMRIYQKLIVQNRKREDGPSHRHADQDCRIAWNQNFHVAG
ncbi:hypothetical protein D1872_310030 [compost metagenome]